MSLNERKVAAERAMIIFYLSVGALIGVFISVMILGFEPIPSGWSEFTKDKKDAETFDIDRRIRIGYIRYDASIGALALENVPDEEPVTATKIKWVSAIIEDLPELNGLATVLLDEPTTANLRKVYVAAYDLSDAYIKAYEHSVPALANAMKKLKENIIRSKGLE